jgi:hypothetical protein
MATHSRIDAKYPQREGADPAPNRRLFPQYYRAPKIDCVLGPGDVLFIPAYWAHWVFSGSDSVALNFWSQAPHEQPAKVSVRLDRFPASASRTLEFGHYRTQSLPFHIVGAAASWPALDRWSDEYLMKVGRELILRTCGRSTTASFCPLVKPQPAYPDEQVEMFPYRSLGDLIEESKRYPRYRYLGVGLVDEESPISDDFVPLEFLADRPILPHLWYNRGQIHTGLHFDAHDGTLAVVRGSKRVLLFPPTAHDHLYFDQLPRRPLVVLEDDESDARKAG